MGLEATTLNVYDANGNVAALVLNPDVDGYESQRTDYTYDAFDRQLTETLPGDLVTTTTYHRNGNVFSVTDPKGQAVESFYDRADRVVETDHYPAGATVPDETRTFEYDTVGNVLFVEDVTGTTGYVYDDLYRVWLESKWAAGADPELDPEEYAVASLYDLNGGFRGHNTPIALDRAWRSPCRRSAALLRLMYYVRGIPTRNTARSSFLRARAPARKP